LTFLIVLLNISSFFEEAFDERDCSTRPAPLEGPELEPGSAGDEPEALIEEARERARRRHHRYAALALALALVGVAAFSAFGGWSDSPSARVSGPDPSLPLASGDRLTKAEYLAKAAAICQAPITREDALAKVRALPRPERDRAWLGNLYLLLQRQYELWEEAGAAGIFTSERGRKLSAQRIDLTHATDSLRGGYGFPDCLPLDLPA
jgi:hypothetical protein